MKNSPWQANTEGHKFVHLLLKSVFKEKLRYPRRLSLIFNSDREYILERVQDMWI